MSLLLLLLCLALGSGLAANWPVALSPTAQVSILVAAPAEDEVYTVYGHAGLRILDGEQGLDVTFNYGVFSFSDDFIYRFVKGETDYMVLPQDTRDYLDEYLGRGSRVEELILNLSPKETAEAWTYLMHNIQPEHRSYRYHFFRDNCATRPLYIVELAVGGFALPSGAQPRAEAQLRGLTWRSEINALEAGMPWLVWGTDLLLGVPTDGAMSARDMTFSPRRLRPYLEQVAKPDGSAVLARVERYPAAGQLSTAGTSTWLSPTVVMALLLLLIGIPYIYIGLRGGLRIPLCCDALIFALAGLGGGLLFYISCLSQHPFVAPNYNLWVLHPLHLLPLVLILIPRWGPRRVVYYHFANFVALTLFVLSSWCLPQHFNVATYLLALVLWSVSLGRTLEHRRASLHGATTI